VTLSRFSDIEFRYSGVRYLILFRGGSLSLAVTRLADSLNTNDRFAIGDRGFVPSDIHAIIKLNFCAYSIEVRMLLTVRWRCNPSTATWRLVVDRQALSFDCGYCTFLDGLSGGLLRWPWSCTAWSPRFACVCVYCSFACAWLLSTVLSFFVHSSTSCRFSFGGTSVNLPTNPTSDTNVVWGPWWEPRIFGILVGLRLGNHRLPKNAPLLY